MIHHVLKIKKLIKLKINFKMNLTCLILKTIKRKQIIWLKWVLKYQKAFLNWIFKKPNKNY